MSYLFCVCLFTLYNHYGAIKGICHSKCVDGKSRDFQGFKSFRSDKWQGAERYKVKTFVQ